MGGGRGRWRREKRVKRVGWGEGQVEEGEDSKGRMPEVRNRDATQYY